MRFKFTLGHEHKGELEISEPDGWRDAVLKLERDDNFHSLIEYFEGSFIFYGESYDYIIDVIKTYGYDESVTIDIKISLNDITYDTVFSGLLKLEAYETVSIRKVQVPIIRNDFWAKFINRIETPVDLNATESLDGDSVDVFEPINLRLTSQKIQQSLEITQNNYTIPLNTQWPEDWTDPDFNEEFPENRIAQINLDDIVLDEIKDNFNIPSAVVPSGAEAAFMQTLEYGGTYEFDIKYSLTGLWISTAFPYASGYHNFSGDSGDPGSPSDPAFTVKMWFQLNGETPIEFTAVHKSRTFSVYDPEAVDPNWDQINGWSEFTFNRTLDIKKGDSYRIWVENTGDPFGYGNNTFTVVSYQLIILGAKGNNVIMQPYFEAAYPGDSLFTDISFAPDYHALWKDFETPNGCESYIRIIAQTVYEETNAFGFFAHDAAGQICDRIIGRNETFYSERLGSSQTIYRQYSGDGCDANYALLKGLQARRYSLVEKPAFMSFKHWWDGINPILNLGLSYDSIDGVEVVRVEEKSYFYDDDISVLISNVSDITSGNDSTRSFKTVNIGYRQGQAESVSGIDDVQLKQTRASRLTKSGTALSLESEFIAASLAIETTRRTTREKSSDYKFDNDTFVIAINPIPVDVSPETSPDVSDYAPETTESFFATEGILNPETRYNLRITPARNFYRWIDYLSIGLWNYLESAFKFTSGEGNYTAVTDLADFSNGCNENFGSIAENADIMVSGNAYHTSLLYTIKVPMSWEEYLSIRNHRNKSIGISQTDENHAIFKIKTIDYEVFNSQCTIQAWAKEYFEIKVIETGPVFISCAPDVAPVTSPLTADNTTVTADQTDITADATEYTL